MRTYITRKATASDIDENTDAENYLARTVFESHELIDIGVLDHNGDPIMARERMDPIGYVRFNEGNGA